MYLVRFLKNYGMGRKSLDKKRKENHQKKREWIVQLYPHLRDGGLKDLKMDEVAKLLGKSKSTVYEYFKSKEEIVAGVVAYKLEALGGFQAILENEAWTYERRFEELVGYIAPILSDISTTLLVDIKNLFPGIWATVESFFSMVSGELMTYYQNGMKEGVFRKVHPAILVESDRFFFFQLVEPEFLKKSELTPQEAFTHYFKMKFHGLLD